MEQLTLAEYLIFGIIIWLALLTFYILRVIGHYRKLTRGAGNIDLGKVLENLFEKQDFHTKKITEIASVISKNQTQSQAHIQKYAIMRFNPFEDAGGDQSFVIALLDAKDNGVVISSLHSRSGTRVYAKSVIGAKAANHQFTKEEKEAVEKAVGKNKHV